MPLILNQVFYRLHGTRHRIVCSERYFIFVLVVHVPGCCPLPRSFSFAIAILLATFPNTLCRQGSAPSGIHPTWASAPDMWAPEIASVQGKGSALFFADTQAKDNACEGELLLVLRQSFDLIFRYFFASWIGLMCYEPILRDQNISRSA